MMRRRMKQLAGPCILLTVVTLWGSACMYIGGEKKRRISKADIKQFSGEFVRYSVNIANEVCRKDEQDEFLPVSFDQVAIPPLLLDHFTESAIKRYFDKTGKDRMRSWMTEFSLPGNFQPKLMAKRELGTQRITSRRDGPYLEVRLHNSAPFAIQALTVHMLGTGRTYQLLPEKAVEPGKDGAFEVSLNQATYDMIRKQKFKVLLTAVTWGKPH